MGGAPSQGTCLRRFPLPASRFPLGNLVPNAQRPTPNAEERSLRHPCGRAPPIFPPGDGNSSWRSLTKVVVDAAGRIDQEECRPRHVPGIEAEPMPDAVRLRTARDCPPGC